MQILASGHPLSYIGVADTAVVALVGYAIVFVGLILLMLVVMAMGKAFVAAANKKKPQSEAVAAAPVQAEVAAPQLAPGTAGSLKLHNVEPKTAAMLMAIVADKTGKPLNELRFLSIKEVTE